MTIEQLYAKLNNPDFQDTRNGDMFYNFFVFQYPAKDEYEIRKQIQQFTENLRRPATYVEVLALDLFKEFCDFLDTQSFGNDCPSLKQFLINEEKTDAANIQEVLFDQANSQEFFKYIHNRIITHVSLQDEMKRPYVFVYGIGDIFPYLRTNVFLTNYERYNETGKYKIIVFYPGHQVGNSFSLFDILEDSHTYRAIPLLNENNE